MSREVSRLKMRLLLPGIACIRKEGLVQSKHIPASQLHNNRVLAVCGACTAALPVAGKVREIEEGLGVQLQLCSKFKASLGCMRLCLQKSK